MERSGTFSGDNFALIWPPYHPGAHLGDAPGLRGAVDDQLLDAVLVVAVSTVLVLDRLPHHLLRHRALGADPGRHHHQVLAILHLSECKQVIITKYRTHYIPVTPGLRSLFFVTNKTPQICQQPKQKRKAGEKGRQLTWEDRACTLF